MIKLKSIFLTGTLILSTLSIPSVFAVDYMAHRTYKAANDEQPYQSEIVNQLDYQSMPSYLDEKSTTSDKWYLCGHSAFATSMNILRSKSANAPLQLEWFHQKLLTVPKYASKTDNPHREASGDWLAQIIRERSTHDFSVEKKPFYNNRDGAKAFLHAALEDPKRQSIIALTDLGFGFGHFVVVLKVKYAPNESGGGYVEFADPYGGYINSKKYTYFLDGMKNSGTVNQYSFWLVSES